MWLVWSVGTCICDEGGSASDSRAYCTINHQIPPAYRRVRYYTCSWHIVFQSLVRAYVLLIIDLFLPYTFKKKNKLSLLEMWRGTDNPFKNRHASRVVRESRVGLCRHTVSRYSKPGQLFFEDSTSTDDICCFVAWNGTQYWMMCSRCGRYSLGKSKRYVCTLEFRWGLHKEEYQNWLLTCAIFIV